MLNKLKTVCSNMPNKMLAFVLAILLASVSVNSYVYDDNIQVNINVDGVTVKTVNTESDTVSSILSKEYVEVNSEDEVNPSQDTKILSDTTISVVRSKNIAVVDRGEYNQIKTGLTDTTELEAEGVCGVTDKDYIIDAATGKPGKLSDGGTYVIIRAFNINVAADNAIYPVSLSRGTVADAIELSGVTIGENDLVYPEVTTQLYEGISIKIVRVAVVHTTETVAIPYNARRVENKYLNPGEEVMTSQGVAGERTVTHLVTYYDGVAVDDKIASDYVTRQPVDEVVEYRNNTIVPASAVAGGNIEGFDYSRVISAKATAYCDKGTTASGLRSQFGVVAVDPRVIPLGTKLYIESTDGSWVYGVCIAGDTGGAVKGNIVDLFYDSYNQCIQFGRRSCNVYVLTE